MAEDVIRIASARDRASVPDLTPDAYFDKLVDMAARICRTPTALVTYVGVDRQYFKAKVGLTCDSTSRDVAFCVHAIEADIILIVPDARLDPRFCNNPLVTGEPFIRFYAGVPVHASDGRPVGTLCVIDVEPRDLDDGQLMNLRQLAKLASARLRGRATAA